MMAMIVAVAVVLTTGIGPVAACPQPPVQAPIAVPFRAPACRWCAGHRGLEYRLTPNTPVRAVAGGVVSFAGTVVGVRYVVVQQADGLRATYGLLASTAIRQGAVVAEGAVVGRSSARLYFGWRRGDDPIDPTPVLGRWVGRRRLVPPAGVASRPASGLRLVCPARAAGTVGR